MGDDPWEKIESFDDIILAIPGKTEEIEAIEAADPRRCPDLQTVGRYWHFCGVEYMGVPDPKPSGENPIYYRRCGMKRLRLRCMGDFEKCCRYRGGRFLRPSDYIERDYFSPST